MWGRGNFAKSLQIPSTDLSRPDTAGAGAVCRRQRTAGTASAGVLPSEAARAQVCRRLLLGIPPTAAHI